MEPLIPFILKAEADLMKMKTKLEGTALFESSLLSYKKYLAHGVNDHFIITLLGLASKTN